MAKLARIKNGVIQNVIVGEPSDFPNLTDVTGTPYGIGWTDNGDGTFSPPPKPPKKWGSTLAFLREFTQSERVAIRKAAANDDAVDDFLFMVQQAQAVRADDADVTDGMQYLVDQGHLTDTRRDEILS